MSDHRHDVFSAKKAKYLTRWSRNIFQNPRRILKPYIKAGMTVLDFGCGNGFFTVEAAKLAGEKGKVIAVDLQQEMLDLLAERLRGTELEKRIVLHKCEKDKIGIDEQVDAVLAFHVVHEVPDKDIFFVEIKSVLKPDGILYLAEPKHRVNKEEFEKTVSIAAKYGFVVEEVPKVFSDRAVVLSVG